MDDRFDELAKEAPGVWETMAYLSTPGLEDLMAKKRAALRDPTKKASEAIGEFTAKEAIQLGLLSAAEFETNDQCVLLEMAQKIYDYAKAPGPVESVGAPGTADTVGDTPGNAPAASMPKAAHGASVIHTPKILVDVMTRDYGRPGIASISDSSGAAYKNNYDVIRDITLRTKSARFLEITPAQVAQLSPLIFISVDYYDKLGTRVKRLPIDFPNHTVLKDTVLQATGQRFGAGIKDISIVHEGIDSATDKIVLINSTFVFQDFRTAAQGNYEELLKVGVKGIDSNLRRYINFEFGWDSHAKLKGTGKDGLALATMRSNVRGELIKYTFEFAEDGSILLKTQHRGHIHTLFGDTPAANILSTQKSAEESLRAGSVKILSASTAKIVSDNKNSLAERKLDEMAALVAVNYLDKMVTGAESKTGQARNVVNLEHDMKGEVQKMFNVAKLGRVGKAGTGGNVFAKLGNAMFDDPEKFDDSPQPVKGPTIDLKDYETILRRANLHVRQAIAQHHAGIPDAAALTNENAKNLQTVGMAKSDVYEMIKQIKGTAQGAKVASDVITDNLLAKNVLKTAQNQFNKKVALLRFTGLFNLATELADKQKIYYGAISSEARIEIHSNLAYQPGLKEAFDKISAESFLTSIRSVGADIPWENEGAQGWAMEKATKLVSTNSFPFVFLGDFLWSLLQTEATLEGKTGTMFQLMKETAGVDMELLLGYMSYETPYANDKINNLPLYYLPISLRKLNYFIAREIIGKDRIFYSLGSLIKDLIKKLIDTSFYNCIREAGTKGTPLTPKIDFAFGEKNGRDVFFIYDSKQFINNMKGKKFGSYSNNMLLKIPHFYLGGANKGIAKTIQLRDIADPSTKTAVYYKATPSNTLEDGNEGPEHGRWAPTVFEMEVNTLGYPNFQLGQLVFVDARQFVGASAQKNFKATGYYGLHKITHRLTPDSFSTTINGIIQMSEKDKDAINSEAEGLTAAADKAKPSLTDPDLLEEVLAAPQHVFFSKVKSGEWEFSKEKLSEIKKDRRLKRLGGAQTLLEKATWRQKETHDEMIARRKQEAKAGNIAAAMGDIAEFKRKGTLIAIPDIVTVAGEAIEEYLAGD